MTQQRPDDTPPADAREAQNEAREALDQAREAQDQAREAVDQAMEQAREHVGPALAGLSLGGIMAGMARRRFRRAMGGHRRRRKLLRRFGFGLLIVVSSVATCSFGVDPSSLTASYGDPVPASRDDATRFLTRGMEAVQRGPDAGAVRITMTEEEATSALSIGMMLPELMLVSERIPRDEIQQIEDLDALRERIWQEAEAQREEMADELGFTQRLVLKLDPKLRTGDVQVRFEETGEVVLAGYVQAWRFRQPGIFVLAPSARDGELTFDFVSGKLGRLPLPELAFDWMGGMVASAILMGREHAVISEITVRDGMFTFEGRLGG